LTAEPYIQIPTTVTAERFLPNKNITRIPVGVTIPRLDIENVIIGVIKVGEEIIYIYPGDWLIYNDGIPSHVMKDSLFKAMYEKV